MMRCQMEMLVMPHNTEPSEVESLNGFSLDQEFDLLAPIVIMFDADLMYAKQAKEALVELKRRSHPLFIDRTVDDVMRNTMTPDGLINRYNELFIAIVGEERPDLKASIDEWGAFGYAPGFFSDGTRIFPYYLHAAAVRERVREIED